MKFETRNCASKFANFFKFRLPPSGPVQNFEIKMVGKLAATTVYPPTEMYESCKKISSMLRSFFIRWTPWLRSADIDTVETWESKGEGTKLGR